MALGTSSGTPSIWLQLNGKTGEMTRWVRPQGDQPGHEEVVRYVTGTVTGVGVKEKTWPNGDTSYALHVRMKDDDTDERYVVEMGATSRVATRLVGQLNNADLSQPIYLRPYMIKEGDKLNNGEVATMDSVLFSVKSVVGVDGDKVTLGDNIRPYYGEQYGDAVPKAAPVNGANGKQLVQNGRPVWDNSEREALTASLIAQLQDKIEALHNQSRQSHASHEEDFVPGEDEGFARPRARG